MYNTRSSINLCYASSTFLYMFVDQKIKVIAKLVTPTLFFPCCHLWYVSKSFTTTLSLNTKFLLASKWGWTISTCVIVGVMQLIFPYLMRPFLITKLNGLKCYEKFVEIGRWCISTFEDSTYQQASCHL
jgi:hypothetical protein